MSSEPLNVSQGMFSELPTRTNLIINYLPPTLQEEELISLFSTSGAVEKVRIMKNYDGTTKGYGFVKFYRQQDAEDAIQKFDGLNLRGKKLKVAFSRPGGARDNANLFVTHLPSKWTSESLGQHFSMFGEVVEARILERNGNSRLCGFVRFNRPEDALDALRHRNNWTPPGAHRQLKVTLATKPKRFGGRNRSRRSSYHAGARSQGSLYSPSPDYIPFPYSTSMPRIQSQGYGYDYDQYYSPGRMFPPSDYVNQDYYEQMNLPDHYETGNTENLSNIQEKDSESQASQSFEPSIFVYNMPTIFEMKDVKNLCIKYGDIKEVELQQDKNGQPLGMAFVTFTDPSHPAKTRDGLSGCKILENQIEVQIL